MYFGKLVFESDEQEFSLKGVKSKKILAVIQEDVLKSVLKVRNARVKVECVKIKRRAECYLHKGGGQGKGKGQSTERGSVHDEE